MTTRFQQWTNLLSYADLTTSGRPSFSKLCVVAILTWAIATNSLTLGLAITVLAASYGRSMFLAFLQKRQSPEPPREPEI